MQRNWELQFTGEKNREKLTKYLFFDEMTQQIDDSLIKKYLNLFYEDDQTYYSHSISTLLNCLFILKTYNYVWYLR